MLYSIPILLLEVCAVLANTEKVMFRGPSKLQIPTAHPTLDDLQLDVLTPKQLTINTHIQAEFPTKTSKGGVSSWVLLHGLREGQLYEVRICWAATQPTSFRLDTYELSTVFETPELITSLAQYSDSRQPDPLHIEGQNARQPLKEGQPSLAETTSVLFLQVLATADYYTINQTLMKNVPPVYVDIILDPYLFNVFPMSLVPTVAYILVLAIASWHLSVYISTRVQGMVKEDIDPNKKKI